MIKYVYLSVNKHGCYISWKYFEAFSELSCVNQFYKKKKRDCPFNSSTPTYAPPPHFLQRATTDDENVRNWSMLVMNALCRDNSNIGVCWQTWRTLCVFPLNPQFQLFKIFIVFCVLFFTVVLLDIYIGLFRALSKPAQTSTIPVCMVRCVCWCVRWDSRHTSGVAIFKNILTEFSPCLRCFISNEIFVQENLDTACK